MSAPESGGIVFGVTDVPGWVELPMTTDVDPDAWALAVHEGAGAAPDVAELVARQLAGIVRVCRGELDPECDLALAYLPAADLPALAWVDVCVLEHPDDVQAAHAVFAAELPAQVLDCERSTVEVPAGRGQRVRLLVADPSPGAPVCESVDVLLQPQDPGLAHARLRVRACWSALGYSEQIVAAVDEVVAGLRVAYSAQLSLHNEL